MCPASRVQFYFVYTFFYYFPLLHCSACIDTSNGMGDSCVALSVSCGQFRSSLRTLHSVPMGSRFTLHSSFEELVSHPVQPPPPSLHWSSCWSINLNLNSAPHLYVANSMYSVFFPTGLYELWKTGRYRSYPPHVLVDLVARILALVPPWTRVYRVQR